MSRTFMDEAIGATGLGLLIYSLYFGDFTQRNYQLNQEKNQTLSQKLSARIPTARIFFSFLALGYSFRREIQEFTELNDEQTNYH